MIESISNKPVRDKFDSRISTTEDIDFETYYKNIGLEFVWDSSDEADLGCTYTYSGQRVIINTVTNDSAAYISGLNAKDEILAINDVRFLKDDVDEVLKTLNVNKTYKITISRLGQLMYLELTPGKKVTKLSEIKVRDEKKALDAFM